MKSFFKYLLATVVGILISVLLLTFVFFGIVGTIISKQEKPVQIKPHSILMLKLNKPIQDRKPVFPFGGFKFGMLQPESKLGLNDILNNIQKAKADTNIRGIYLDLSIVPAGIATLEEIRDALLDFKKSGKFILSYSDTYLQSTYYLASAADKVYLNPAGNFSFVGLSSQIMFYKGALEKLGLQPEIIRHGKFKSAVEPLMLDKMSAANREQIKAYVGSIWEKIVHDISISRHLSKNELNKLANNLSLNTAQSAVNYKLVDATKFKDQVYDELKTLSGVDSSASLKLVKLSAYSKVPEKKTYKGLARDKIAVIYASGDVVMGDEKQNNIGSEGIAETIRKARKDKNVKAIVFRVNSGGGSALASEVIWRELDLAKKVKPVIASFGDVAASGGYFIACPADTIVAEPTTITGSIGVFGVLLNSKEFLNKKLGITVDVYKTNDYSDFASVFRPLSPLEKQFFQISIDTFYDTFISHVAEGRGMEKSAVDSIGEGRVWSGINAKQIGLIDVFGGLTKAIEIAKEKAGLENYRIEELPEQVDPFQQIMNQLSEEVKVKILSNELGSSYKYYKFLKNIESYNGIQARLPYEISIY